MSDEVNSATGYGNLKFAVGEAPKELLRVTPDGKVHTEGRVYDGWAEYVQYVAELETSAKEVCEYFEADYDIPPEVKKLMELLECR